MGTAVFLASGLPGQAADSSPADALLARARDAVATHEFTGRVRIGWRTDGGLRTTTVPVRAVDGGLRMAQGAVVADDGRAWLRTQARWETLWSSSRTSGGPSVAAKYRVRVVTQGPTIAGRPTRTLTIALGHRVVERYDLDRDLGLVLRRVRLDDRGRVAASMTFEQLGPVHEVQGTMRTPPIANDAPRGLARPPADARREIGHGFELTGAQRVGRETQLFYSDGVFTASVFTRDGELDRDALPSGGTDVRVGGLSARRYRTASGTVLAWESRGHAYTCVTDASDGEQRAMLASLRGGDDSAWVRAVRFVTAPFSWF
jgi:hypothetical protein